jgi:putative NADH-flavin reductase
MSKITVFGGTGYAGSNIAREAATRGHDVTVIARKAPVDPIAGVNYEIGSALDADLVGSIAAKSDVIVSALAGRGDMAGRMREVAKLLTEAAVQHQARIGFVGGAGSLSTVEGGPRIVDGDFPEDYKPEALEMAEVLEDLRGAGELLDWFYVSPAGSFGAFNPGERRGAYRIGGDVLVVDSEGKSDISGEDFGMAIVDEIENPKHRRSRFTVAY